MSHPIVDALLSHVRSGIYPMHVPGHKQGRGSDSVAASVVSEYFYKIDLTEIPGLDDLCEPSGCIKEAEMAAASLFGADRSFLLVNGATVGILAAILSTCTGRSKLAISRTVHRSVISGVALSGAELVLVDTMVSPRYLIPLGVDAEAVERCLSQESDIAAVLVTNPSYYGICQDLSAVAAACHKHGVILIVDEAHGGHLSFCDDLPMSGLQSGADIVIQSAHKTLGSVTQTALMHVRGSKVDCDRVAANLRMLQTSSPSYILMASLDSVLHRLVTEGRQLVSAAVANSISVRSALDGSPVSVVSQADVGPVFSIDPTRLTISAAECGVLGPDLEERLRVRGFQVEFSDLLSVVAVITYADAASDLQRFCEAVNDSLRCAPSGSRSGREIRERVYPLVARAADEAVSRVLSVRDAVMSPHRHLSLDQSIGRIAAECVCPYPPGVPLLFPGQEITPAVIDLIREFMKAGVRFHGIHTSSGESLLAAVDEK
jgi:arginine decarboxylase